MATDGESGVAEPGGGTQRGPPGWRLAAWQSLTAFSSRLLDYVIFALLFSVLPIVGPSVLRRTLPDSDGPPRALPSASAAGLN